MPDSLRRWIPLALLTSAAPLAFAESGVTHKPYDPADFQKTALVATGTLPKSVPELFADFDAAYAAASDLKGRGRAAKDYLTILQKGKAPEERAQVVACVRRFREAEGPAGLYRLYLSVPNAHIPIVLGELDGFEKKMLKALAENHVRDAAAQQQASLAEPSRPFALSKKKTSPEKPATDAKSAPPAYDAQALRVAAFGGDGRAAFDLALHYGGIRDESDADSASCRYWASVARRNGYAVQIDAVVKFARSEDPKELDSYLGTLRAHGSLVAAAALDEEKYRLPEPFVSRTKTTAYTFKDGSKVVARHKTLGDAFGSLAVTWNADLSHVAVEETPDRKKPACLVLDGVPQRHSETGILMPKVVFAPVGDRVAYVAKRFLRDTKLAPYQWGEILVVDGKLAAETAPESGTHFQPKGFSPDGKKFLLVESGKLERLLLDFKFVGGGEKIGYEIAWLGDVPVHAALQDGIWKLFAGEKHLRDLPGQPSAIRTHGARILVATYGSETAGAYVFLDDKKYGPFGAVDLPGFSPTGKRAYWYASPAEDKERKMPQKLWMDGVPTIAEFLPLDRRPPAFDDTETRWIAHGPKDKETGYSLVLDGRTVHTSKYSSLRAPSLSPDGNHWGVVAASGRTAEIVIDGAVVAGSKSPPITADDLMNDRLTSPELFWKTDSTPAWIVGDGKGWLHVAKEARPVGPFDNITTKTLIFHENRAIFEGEIDGESLLCVEGGKIITLPGAVRHLAVSGKTLRVLIEQSENGKRPKRSRYGAKDGNPNPVALMEFDLAEIMRPVAAAHE